jgi:uncharacterized protein YceK
MTRILLLLLVLLLLCSGCTTINVSVPPNATGGNYTINITANRQVPITGTMSPSGNTVPVSAVP